MIYLVLLAVMAIAIIVFLYVIGERRILKRTAQPDLPPPVQPERRSGQDRRQIVRSVSRDRRAISGRTNTNSNTNKGQHYSSA